MIKKVLIVLASFVFAVSIMANIVFIYRNHNTDGISPVGTYCYVENDNVWDNIYFVFDDYNNYCVYQQGNKLIEKGKYKLNKKENIIVINNNRKVVLEPDKIYFAYKNDCKIFEKHEDVPTYINFKH